MKTGKATFPKEKRKHS